MWLGITRLSTRAVIEHLHLFAAHFFVGAVFKNSVCGMRLNYRGFYVRLFQLGCIEH